MVCFGFKGGIGTASRVVAVGGKRYTVGVLVQCNTGDRKVLRIAGAPVGQALAKRWLPCFDPKLATGHRRAAAVHAPKARSASRRPTRARSSSSSAPTRP